jgi:hypothetical protein
MSIEADSEMQLSAQLAADVSGLEVAEMRHLLSETEALLLDRLQQPIGSKERLMLQGLIQATNFANEVVSVAWAEVHVAEKSASNA